MDLAAEFFEHKTEKPKEETQKKADGGPILEAIANLKGEFDRMTNIEILSKVHGHIRSRHQWQPMTDEQIEAKIAEMVGTEGGEELLSYEELVAMRGEEPESDLDSCDGWTPESEFIGPDHPEYDSAEAIQWTSGDGQKPTHHSCKLPCCWQELEKS